MDVAEAVARARARNPALRAILRPTFDAALARDAALAEAGASGPLHRVPYTLKDVWDVEGLPTTFGSTTLDAPAPASGAIHRAFRDAGAVLIGKTNLSDRGITPESESWVGGATVHPEDPTRTSGGSSGGAAAAVASGMAAFDWGTDFGGSVRLPAAFCGVVGLRLSARTWPMPPRGAPRHPALRPLVAMGPIARDLATCRAVLEAAAPTLRRDAPPLPPLRGVVVLGPDRFSRGAWAGFEPAAHAAIERAGLACWSAPLPAPRVWDDAFVGLIASHADALVTDPPIPPSAVLAGLLGLDRRLHPRSARVLAELALLRLGRDRDPGAARARVEALRARLDALFAAGFLLATPTTTHPAPRRGRALSIRGLAAFVKLGNLADATALSVPFGRFAEGLPRGLQLLGPAGSERRLLDVAERVAPAFPI